jgi:hypothetical protein
MAFKIRNFYANSPLHNHHDKNKVVKDPKGDPVTIIHGNTSPNRDLTESEIRRRKKKLAKLNSKENLSKRKQRKKIKIEDQLSRGQDGESDAATEKMIKSGLLMKEDCAAMKAKAAKLDKEVKAMIAESKKTGKVTNWDAKADELSRVRERIATNCKK